MHSMAAFDPGADIQIGEGCFDTSTVFATRVLEK